MIDEDASLKVIESCRRVLRDGAARYHGKGARIDDIAIGITYAALDIATVWKDDPHAAIEWLRTVLDVQERGLLESQRPQ
ncbi:MAG: hypothetical protein AB7G25_07980 [Sphingomonadaceae bacterium]